MREFGEDKWISQCVDHNRWAHMFARVAEPVQEAMRYEARVLRINVARVGLLLFGPNPDKQIGRRDDVREESRCGCREVLGGVGACAGLYATEEGGKAMIS